MQYQHMHLKKTGHNAPSVDAADLSPSLVALKLIVRAQFSGLTLSTTSQGLSQFSASSNILMACSFITKQHLSLSTMQEFIDLCLLKQHAEAFTHNLALKPHHNIYCTIPFHNFFDVNFLLNRKQKQTIL